jgi:hypothetical protein
MVYNSAANATFLSPQQRFHCRSSSTLQITSPDAAVRASTCLKLASIFDDAASAEQSAANEALADGRLLKALVQCAGDVDMAVRLHALGALRNIVLAFPHSGADDAGAVLPEALRRAAQVTQQCITHSGSVTVDTELMKQPHSMVFRVAEQALKLMVVLCEGSDAVVASVSAETCAPLFLILSATESDGTTPRYHLRHRITAAYCIYLATEGNDAMCQAVRTHPQARALLQRLVTMSGSESRHMALYAAGTVSNAYLLPVLRSSHGDSSSGSAVSAEEATAAGRAILSTLSTALGWNPLTSLSSVCEAFAAAVRAYAAVEAREAQMDGSSDATSSGEIGTAKQARVAYQEARRQWFRDARAAVLAMELLTGLLEGDEYNAVDDTMSDADSEDASSAAHEKEGTSALSGPATELLRSLHSQMQAANISASLGGMLSSCLNGIALPAAHTAQSSSDSETSPLPPAAITAISSLPLRFRQGVALALLALIDRSVGCIANVCETIPLEGGTGETSQVGALWRKICELLGVAASSANKESPSSLWLCARNDGAFSVPGRAGEELATLLDTVVSSIDSEAEAVSGGVQDGEIAVEALGQPKEPSTGDAVESAAVAAATAAATSTLGITNGAPASADPAVTALLHDPMGLPYGTEDLEGLALSMVASAEPVLGSFSAALAASTDAEQTVRAVGSLAVADASALFLQARVSAIPSLVLALVAILRRERAAVHCATAGSAFGRSQSLPALASAIVVPSLPQMRLIGGLALEGVGRSVSATSSTTFSAPVVALRSMTHVESADCESRTHAIAVVGLLGAPLPTERPVDEPPYRIPGAAHEACGKSLASILVDASTALPVVAAAGDALIDCYSYETHNRALKDNRLLDACRLSAKSIEAKMAELASTSAPGAHGDVASMVTEVRRNLVRFVKYKEKLI